MIARIETPAPIVDSSRIRDATNAERPRSSAIGWRIDVKRFFLTTATILGFCLVSIPRAIGAPDATLAPADTYFVSQTSLGTPFQVDSGELAVAKGTTQPIRNYAQLMVSSHEAVNNALEAILKTKSPIPPPTLLKAAYSTMISTLSHDDGQMFDADYVRGQVNYQKGNVALYQYELANGVDPDLKAFAQQTLPKIQDHLQRALKLQGGVE